MTKSSSKYYCYILRSHNQKYSKSTYNGSTNDINRRLRQHNGIISGGAKATRGKGEWIPYVIMEGFSTHREALSCEWKIKHPTNTKRRPSIYNGVEGRIKSLNLLIGLDKWTSKSTGLETNNKYKLYIQDEYIDLIDLRLKKNNIEIIPLSELII